MNPIGPSPHFSPSSTHAAEGARPAEGADRLGTSFRLAQPRFSGGLDSVPQLPPTPLAQRQVVLAPQT